MSLAQVQADLVGILAGLCLALETCKEAQRRQRERERQREARPGEIISVPGSGSPQLADLGIFDQPTFGEDILSNWWDG